MPFLRRIAEQQADQGAFLWVLRTHLAARGGTHVAELRRVDARLAAHLDGLALAGAAAWPLCRRPLAHPARGECFVATAVALRLGEDAAIARCLRSGRTRRSATVRGAAWAREVGAAFEWTADARPPEAEHAAARTLATLCASRRAADRLAAIDAAARVRWCSRADAPDALVRALDDPHAAVRARAARGLGELGVPVVDAAAVRARLRRTVGTDVAAVARWAAWTLVRLGTSEGHAAGAARPPEPAAGWRDVLADGRQHERRRVAWQRALLAPETPLFPTAAPAMRQDALLGASSAAAPSPT